MSQEDEKPEDKKSLPERAKEKAVQVGQHVKDNKATYIACGLTGTICVLGTRAFMRPVINFNPIIDINNTPNIAPVFNNHIENNLGRVSKIVRDVATGQEWPKIKYLAEKIAKDQGITVKAARNLLNRHFRGELSTVFDKTYEIAGLRTDF